MRTLLNQYSFVIIAAVLLAIETVALRRWRWVRRATLAVTVIAAVAFAFGMRPGTGDVRAVGDLDRALARGRPVALKFFSNY